MIGDSDNAVMVHFSRSRVLMFIIVAGDRGCFVQSRGFQGQGWAF